MARDEARDGAWEGVWEGAWEGALEAIRDGILDGRRDGTADASRDEAFDAAVRSAAAMVGCAYAEYEGDGDGHREPLHDGLSDGLHDGLSDGLHDGLRDLHAGDAARLPPPRLPSDLRAGDAVGDATRRPKAMVKPDGDGELGFGMEPAEAAASVGCGRRLAGARCAAGFVARVGGGGRGRGGGGAASKRLKWGANDGWIGNCG